MNKPMIVLLCRNNAVAKRSAERMATALGQSGIQGIIVFVEDRIPPPLQMFEVAGVDDGTGQKAVEILSRSFPSESFIQRLKRWWNYAAD